MSDLATNYDFKIINKFLGYNSASDKTNIDEKMLVRGSQNVYKKLSGTIASRPGMKRRGDADTTIAAINSEFVWNTSWGATLPLRIANSKLEVEYEDVWYQIAGSLTETRYVFDKWWDNTEKKDRVLMVNGTANIFHWSGGIAEVASSTLNTITKTGSESWQQAGFATNTAGEKKVTIDGTEYTYTGGETTTTLTGVTPDASGITVGEIAIQSLITEATTPASGFLNNFIKVINNQAYVGSYTSRLCYISSNTDFTNYTVPATRAPGDPELLTLDAALKGIGVRQGNAHIGFGTNSWAVIKFTSITVGSTLTQQTVVDVKPMTNLGAPYAHEFIDTVGDTLIFLSQDQQLRTFGDYRNIFTPAYPALSQEVFTELSEENFASGALKSIGDFTYLTAPASGKVYIYQVRQSVDDQGNVVSERLWHSPQIWNITRVDEIGGVVYGFSNSNPQLYQLWDTGQWHDDSPTDEPIPYTCIAAFAYRNHGRRQGLISFDKLYSEGYISEGTALGVQIKYDYQGSTAILDATINSVERPARLFSGSNAVSMGDSSLGDNPIGDGLSEDSNDQELLPKYKVISSMSLENCFEYQVIYYSTEEDSRWELLATGTNAQVEKEQQATFIINKLRN